MKSFEEYLLEHLSIEYYNSNVLKNKVIIEKYGIYDDCDKLAVYIDKQIGKLYNNYKVKDNIITIKKSQLLEYKNIFFETLTINVFFNTDYDDASYIAKNSFDNIELNIHIKKYKSNDIIDLLMHELQHAYNDYILQLKGDALNKKINTKYYKSISDWRNSKNNWEFLLKNAMYMLFNYEQNAFIAQIKSQLIKHKEEIHSPEDALKVLKSSDIYQSYIFINDMINVFENNNDDEDIVSIYNKFAKKKCSTKNQVLKTLKTQYNKLRKKLEVILPKMCVENLNNDYQCFCGLDTRNFINELKNRLKNEKYY